MLGAFYMSGDRTQLIDFRDQVVELWFGSGDPNISGVVANGYNDPNLPGNVIDGDVNTMWSHNASPSILDLQLVGPVPVGGISIHQYYNTTSPDTNAALFDIYTSTDGTNWELVYHGKTTQTGMQPYRWPTVTAAYVRYYGLGRTSSEWNSILEVEILGPTSTTLYSVPPSISVSSGDEQNAVSWDTPRPSPAPLEWVLERSLSEGSGYVTLESGITVPYSSTAPYNDTGLTNDTTYWYRANAVNSSGTAIGTPVSGTPTETSIPVGDLSHGLDLVRPDSCPNPTPGSGNCGLTVSVGSLTSSGPITTSYNGQVIENEDVWETGRGNWAITINHDNVTVRNCRIRHSNGAEGIKVNGNNALIEHNHFCGWEFSSTAIGHKSTNNNVGQRTLETGGDARYLTIRRNYVHLARSAFAIRGKDIDLVENYLHFLADENSQSPHTGKPNSPGGAPFHGTAASSAGDGRRNSVLRNRFPQGSSGGVNIYSRIGSHSDWNVMDNYFVGSNKGFAIYGGRVFSPSYYNQNRNIKIEGNRFSGKFGFSSARGRGTNAAVDLSRPGNTFYNNRFVGENTDLPARCGIAQDDC